MKCRNLEIRVGGRRLREVKSEYGGFYVGEKEVNSRFLSDIYDMEIEVDPEKLIKPVSLVSSIVKKLVMKEDDLKRANGFVVGSLTRGTLEEGLLESDSFSVRLTDRYQVHIQFCRYNFKKNSKAL